MGTAKRTSEIGAGRGRTPASLRTLLLLAGLTFVLRAPALASHPFCIDESYYAAGAAELLAGGTFYRDVVDHKPPGIYLLYALAYRVAGVYNQWAVHALLIATVTLTAYLLGMLTQSYFGAQAGRYAGIVYLAASVVGPANDFQAANTELFMNLPLVAACWLCARLWASGRALKFELFATGGLVAVAMIIRPQAAVVILPIAVIFLRRGIGISKVTWALLGAVLPVAILLMWLGHNDALGDALTSLSYARTYTSSLPFEVKLANATLKTLFFLAIDVGLIIPATVWVARARRSDPTWRSGVAGVLLTWLAGSFVAVAAGGRFYPHYFIQVLPPLAVLAARQLTQWQSEVRDAQAEVSG
jgi:hypothetical protein